MGRSVEELFGHADPYRLPAPSAEALVRLRAAIGGADLPREYVEVLTIGNGVVPTENGLRLASGEEVLIEDVPT